MHRALQGTPSLLRAVNRRTILDEVRRVGETSRAELSKTTSIRPPTVSAVIRQLLDEGLVEEVGSGAPFTGTGRPPRMVALARGKPRALGFEISGLAIRGGLCDITGTVQSQVRVDFAAGSPAETVERLYEVGDSLLAAAGCTWADLHGVGIALPGLVDTAGGLVRWSRPLKWSRVPLQCLCEDRWIVGTDIVNNAVAGSLAAYFLSFAKNVENLIYLHLRFKVVEPGFADEAHPIVRVGSGIIVQGEPYHGDFGAAGEISQPVQHPLLYARDEAGQPFADIEALVWAFEAGEPGALAALDRLSADVGTVVRVAVGILDPGMVVVDSDVSALRDLLLPRLDRLLNEDYLRKEAGTTRVVGSALGEYGMVRGAIVPTLQRVFELPRRV